MKYIGIWNDYGASFLATWEDVKKYYKGGVYSLVDYADGRRETNLDRFVYDPYTGEKIDWKALREDARRIEK